MHKILLWAFCLFCLALTVDAKAQSVDKNATQPEIKGVLRHSLIHWLDPYLPSAQIGLDYKIGPRTYLRHDVGYFFDIGYNEPRGLVGINGIRLRNGYRKYQQSPRRLGRLTYIEFNLDYRYLDLLIAGDFRRDNFNFQQRINYSVWQHSLTANIQTGFFRHINEHWRLDLGFGLGLRVNYRKYSSVPSDASFITNGPYLGWEYASRRGLNLGLNIPIVVAIAYQW
ncbi:MAG: hypothetical protein AAFO03_07140 [Bacteroidota bacterium]